MAAVYCDDDGHVVALGTDCDSMAAVYCDDDGHVVALEVRNGNISASIPESITALEELSWLYIKSSELTGSLPPALFTLPNLTAGWAPPLGRPRAVARLRGPRGPTTTRPPTVQPFRGLPLPIRPRLRHHGEAFAGGPHKGVLDERQWLAPRRRRGIAEANGGERGGV
ncbi:hypothetical protein CLOP_g10695 [Closterium sp. NIES-67]|nr:hypothetical protein CLOP_g10695 [Closterium sp. NIES-67]